MRTVVELPLKKSVIALAVGTLSLASISMYGQEVRRLPIATPVVQPPTAQDAGPSPDLQTAARTPETQTTRPITVGKVRITGYPSDWTQHRVIFSSLVSEDEAYRQGRHTEWLRAVNDPRYVLHALKRAMPTQGSTSEEVAEREAVRLRVAELARGTSTTAPVQGEPLNANSRHIGDWGSTPPAPKPTSNSIGGKEDWNVPLTTGNSIQNTTVSVSLLDDAGGTLTGATIQPYAYPAKYTYNANGTGNCPNDFIVYPTGLAGVTTGDYTVPLLSLLGVQLGTVTVDGPGTPNIIAYNNIDTGVLSGLTSCGTILAGVLDLNLLLNQNLSPNPTVMWAYNTGGPVTGSPVLSLDGSQVAYIQQTSASSKTAQLALLKWSSPGNSASVTLTVGGLLTLGTSEMINGYEYSYGVGNIGLINIGGLTSNYPIATAPLAASCASAGGVYQKAVAGEGTGSPATPYVCVMTLKHAGVPSTTVTHSNPFPDYQNGAMYVGDDQGYLHMFTGLSFGEPGTASGQAGSTAAIAEANPLTLSSYPLGAPAYDNVSGCVFVGDSAGVLYEVNPGFGGGTICNGSTPGLTLYGKTVPLASSTTNGILDAPMVDSNSQAVYVFVSSSSTAGGLTSGSNAVYQFVPGFTGSNATPTSAQAVGTGGSTLEFLDGDFDNVYYSSSDATGHMYVVGNTHTLGNGSLFQIPVTKNKLGTPKNLGTLNTSSGYYAYASPILEFCNNGGAACAVSGGQTTAGLDIVYFSVYKGYGGILGGLSQALTNTNCSVGSVVLSPGGCIYGVNVSNPAAPTLYADYYTSWAGSATNPCWVTGGLVVDNADTSLLDLNALGAGSQMYFVGFNGNSDSLLTNYDPCGTTKTTGNTIDAQQIGQGNLVL
jgi:hypothetical protein